MNYLDSFKTFEDMDVIKKTESSTKNIGYKPLKGERVMYKPSFGPLHKKYPNGVKGVITKVYPDLFISWGYDFLPDGEKKPIPINLGISSIPPFIKLVKKSSSKEKGGYEPKKRGEKVIYWPKNYLQTRYPNGVLVTVQDLWAGENPPNFRWYILIPVGGTYKDKLKVEVNKLKDKFPFEKYTEPESEDEEYLRAEPTYCNGERIVKLINMALPLFDDISDVSNEIDICMDKLNRLKKYFEQ